MTTENKKIKVTIGTAHQNGIDWHYRTDFMTEEEFWKAKRYENNLYSISKA